MKSKVLSGLLIGVFIISAFGVARVAAANCPKCGGTGTITQQQPCPTCHMSVPSKPVLKITDRSAVAIHGVVSANVRGLFRNEEPFGVDAIFTGQIKTQTETYTNTSSTIHFNANEEIWVIVPITVKETFVAPDWSYQISVSNVENVVADCPTCSGTGYILVTAICPDCGGTGVLSANFGDFANIEGVGGIVVGVAVVGAVIGASFFILKKKRVTEETLRRLSSFEFQDWAAKRLGSSSQSGSYLGIDGFTAEGYPFQVRQEDDVGRRAIDSFAAAVGRAKARSGTIVAFSFGRDALEGVTRARLNYGLEIKTVTVRELLIGQKRYF